MTACDYPDRPPALVPNTIPLCDYGHPQLRCVCDQCPIRATYSTAEMIAKVGRYYPLTWLRARIAFALRCPVEIARREGRLMAHEPRCGLRFADVAKGGGWSDYDEA